MQTPLQRRVARASRISDSDYLVMRPLSAQIYQQCAYLHGCVLDLGCGNQPYRNFLVNASQYVAYDIDPVASSPEVVGVAQVLPFKQGSFDGILSTQVLEHVPKPWVMVDEIARVLRPNGLLVLSAPLSWRLHEQPYDFYRYTRYGLISLLQQSGLKVLDIFPQGGVWTHIGQMMNNTMWRGNPRKYSPGWISRKLGTVAINKTCTRLDQIWPDEEDTLNYVVFAQKADLLTAS
ncbi:class I SAM-dependent methyltransferase [Chloroflexales bacterium ZM16-3]|nr:class I SAM-dependent methyltransferase [Chloroflexales bacterium ZM16-3]